MVAQPKPIAAAKKKMVAARRKDTTEPGRAGAWRLALVSALLAAAVGAAAYVTSRHMLATSTIDRLEAISETARRDLATMLGNLTNDTAQLSEDPRTASALREFRDAFRKAPDELAGRDGSKLEAYDSTLARFYDGQFLPKLAIARGTTVPRSELYPSNDRNVIKDAPVILQALYLAQNRFDDSEKYRLGDSKDGSSYTRVHIKYHPWLEATARRNGWLNVLLIDSDSSHVVYSSAKTPDTFTALRNGPYKSSGLALAAKNAAEARERGVVRLTDFDRAEAYADKPVLYASTPLFDGLERIGVLAVAIGVDRVDDALMSRTGPDPWGRIGLGATGDLVAVGNDLTLRSSPREFLEHRDQYLAANASDLPLLKYAPSPVALATWSSGPVKGALGGHPASGDFATADGPIFGAYTPLSLGELHWAIAAEMQAGEALAPLQPLLIILVLVALAAAVAGWGLGGRLWQQFAGRLAELSDVVRRVQHGDRRARLEVKQKGAVGDLAEAINRLLDDRLNALGRSEQETERLQREVERLVGVVAEASGGDLTQRASAVDGTLGNVGHALNLMLENVSTLVNTLKSASGRVVTSADRIRTSAEQLSQGAATQTRDIGATSGSLKTLTAACDRVVQNCRATLESVRRGEEAGRMAQTAVSDVASGMDGLQRETRAATVKIKRLGERSMQISAIIGTISKMSAQTDMLALNAAIEASRAGEHGQGFTVVAEEVRKLAERAAAATKEIERVIAGIQSDINEAVGGMERHGERLEIQSAAASQAGQALKRILSAAADGTRLVQEITGAAEEQVAISSKLAETVAGIAEFARNVQQSSDQARRTTNELMSVSDQLTSQIGQFHT